MDLLRTLLCKRLKELRESRGLSQKDLAGQLNLAYSTYNQWETGAAWPSSINLEGIASYYKVRSSIFFHDPELDESNPDISNYSHLTSDEIVKTLEELIQKIKH